MAQTAADAPPILERPPAAGSRGRGARQIVDSLLCLAVAVILFRTFLVEGYLISTGSMAPALLGYHKRVVCPACQYEFACGVAYDSSTGSVLDAGSAGASGAEQLVACPNCGQDGIDVARVPPNQGDQLLVQKDVYALQPPRRWEVVVFRNPTRRTQAYVKRVVGLPGETVHIDGGEVYIDGELARKDLRSQRAMRILVYDYDREPQDDPAWQPRWVAQSSKSRWRRDGQAFVLDEQPGGSEAAGLLDWVTYRHWVRSGGLHETAVPLPADLDGVAVPYSWSPVQYDASARQLTCIGVLSEADRDRLLSLGADPRYQKAVRRLYERAHLAPVTDSYGYNPWYGGSRRVAVRDLMLSAEVTIQRGEGRFALQMTDGDRIYEFLIDAGAKEMRLGLAGTEPPTHKASRVAGAKADRPCPGSSAPGHAPLSPGHPQPAHKAPLPQDLIGRPVLVEMSLFDRQIIVALDGEPVFAPWRVEAPADSVPPPRKPVRFGACGLTVRVDHLRLDRDVYYTRADDEAPYRLGADEYFVLGDNSPVSHDSRRWPHPAVNAGLLLGKPFVVHLPSRQAKLTIGSFTRYIRIPDLPRIRYIR